MGEAIVAGVIGAFFWTLIVLVFWVVRRLLRYYGLRGGYEGRMTGSDTVERTMRIRVRGNRLKVSGRRNEDGATFRGDILMSDEFARSGRGHYHRDDAPDAYGFWEVHVVDTRTILVHETYAHPADRIAVVTGFVWSRITT